MNGTYLSSKKDLFSYLEIGKTKKKKIKLKKLYIKKNWQLGFSSKIEVLQLGLAKLGKFQFELIIIMPCDWEVLATILRLLISFRRTSVQLKFLYY